MKVGETIMILPSCALTDMRLEELAGQDATILEVVGRFNNVTGCWVELRTAFCDETEWFIPYNSIG